MIPGPVPTSPPSKAAIRKVIREELRALLTEVADVSNQERDLSETHSARETAFSAVGEIAVAVSTRMGCSHERTYQYVGEPNRCADCGKAISAAR